MIQSKILMIDNYDSFTYNIVQYLQQLQQEVVVWKNDGFELAEIADLSPDAIIIGPGPCSPNEAGQTLAVIERYKDKLPILGICLGHQAIAQAFGATITQASEIMHGRLSDIYHHQQGVFQGLASPTQMTRYHSLVIDQHTLPPCLEMTAWTQVSANEHSDHSAPSQLGEIMGIRHRYLPIEGVQFHPESILSCAGYHLLNNFLTANQLAKLSNHELPSVG